MSRIATRTSRLRQIEELLLVKPDGLHVTDLARRLGVDRRTIYRDLDFLSDQGVPLWQQNGCFGINRTHYLATIRVSFQEALALALAGRLLSHTVDERNWHVISALRKLAAVLPHPLAAHLDRAAGRVQHQADGQSQVAVLETLAEGWGTGRKVRVEYRSPRSGALRERVLSPYALEPSASGIYVIGHDAWADDIRVFKLERLESAVLLDQTYTVPDGFDPDAYLATSWGVMAGPEVMEVVLRFSSAAAVHVRERRWHPSQSLAARPDGGCLLTVRVSEPLEMQPWIRSWGGQVEVLAPDWLRERIAAELRQAAQQYSASPPPGVSPSTSGDTSGLGGEA